MRVDRDHRLAEGDVEHDIRGLAADARERRQFLARARHVSAMPFDQQSRQGDDIFRLGAVEADRFDQVAHALLAKRRHLGGRVGLREERWSRFVDPCIGRLRGQHDGDEQRERVFVTEFGLGFRICGCETRKNLFDARSFSGRRPPTGSWFFSDARALTDCFRHRRVITFRI